MKKAEKLNGYIKISAGYEGQGTSLSLEIPARLYCDFAHCFDDDNEKGAKTLEDLFDLYISLTDKQKEIYQFSIYDNCEKIFDTEDLVIMLRALKRVMKERGI